MLYKQPIWHFNIQKILQKKSLNKIMKVQGVSERGKEALKEAIKQCYIQEFIKELEKKKH